MPSVAYLSRTSRLAGQLSLVALLAGFGAGCTGLGGITGPKFTGSTTNQRQIIGGSGQGSGMPAYAATPQAAGYGGYASDSAGVQSSDLPPPPGAAPRDYSGSGRAYTQPSYSQPPGYQQPPAYQPPKPYAASGMPAPVGQVAYAGGSVRPPSQSLVQLGAPPSTLGEQAARIDPPRRSSGGGAGGTHTVAPGDTMYNIARRYNVPVSELIAANGGSGVAKLGQRVTIPGGGSSPSRAGVQLASLDTRSVPSASHSLQAPTPSPISTPPIASAEPPASPIAAAKAAQPPAQQIAALPPAAAPVPGAAPAAPPAAAPQAASNGTFRWPVRGKVISGFGKKSDGERNDGINLAVPEGTPVKAAEDGTVIYAGSELKSYGNLVLVRHANGWVSAYAHNGALKVKRGDSVRRGEVVATSGMSGGVTTPQVHFELRKDATPVDPLTHMAEN